MKTHNIITAVLIGLLLFSVAFGQAPGVAQIMTNATVVQMVQTKISPDLIILAISKCTPAFQLDPANAQYMLRAGVTEEIYKAMAARQMGEPIPGFTTQPSSSVGVQETRGMNNIVAGPRAGQIDSEYGFQLGSVVAAGGGGFLYTKGVSGIHPSFGGDVSVGVAKYLGIFGHGNYSLIARDTYCSQGCISGSVNELQFLGGFEAVGSNHSRVVPFGRVGGGLVRGIGTVSGYGVTISASVNVPAVAFGGGFRVYANKHFGFVMDVSVLRTVGNYGGGWLVVPTAGLFAQSR